MNGPQRPRILMISLELLQSGQAASTHFLAIRKALSDAGYAVGHVARTAPNACPNGMLHKVWRYIALSLKAIALLRVYDVFYVRSHPAAVLFVAVATLAGKPVVHEINGRMDDLGYSYRLKNLLIRTILAVQNWQYRHASALIAVTQGLRDWAAALPGVTAPVHVISNGVDPEVFRPDADAGPGFAAPYVLFFGGLVAWHGIETMIAAVDDPHWPADVRLVIVGDGLLSPRVNAAAASSKGRIVAAGYLEQSALAGVAARSHAILIPIEAHGGRGDTGVAPLKLFEAMASGPPVIATDLPYQRDIIERAGCGVIVPRANPAALASAVGKLAENPVLAREMGQNGRKEAIAVFSWAIKGQETAKVLESVYPRKARIG